MWALIHPPIRWSVQVVEMLTIPPKGRLRLLLALPCFLCSEVGLEINSSSALAFKEMPSLVSCRCMGKWIPVSSQLICAAGGGERGQRMG